jgi:hypothetical protein
MFYIELNEINSFKEVVYLSNVSKWKGALDDEYIFFNLE